MDGADPFAHEVEDRAAMPGHRSRHRRRLASRGLPLPVLVADQCVHARVLWSDIPPPGIVTAASSSTMGSRDMRA